MKHVYNENYSFFFFDEKYVDFIQNKKDTKRPETQSFQYMMGFPLTIQECQSLWRVVPKCVLVRCPAA